MVMSDAIWPLGFIELSVHRSMLQVLSPLLWAFELSINIFIFALGQCYIKFSINEFIDFSYNDANEMSGMLVNNFLNFSSAPGSVNGAGEARHAPPLHGDGCRDVVLAKHSWLSAIENVKSLKSLKSLRYFFRSSEIDLSFCSYFVISSNCSAFLCPLRVHFSNLCFEHPLDFRLHQGSQRRIPQFLPQILGKLLCT